MSDAENAVITEILNLWKLLSISTQQRLIDQLEAMLSEDNDQATHSFGRIK